MENIIYARMFSAINLFMAEPVTSAASTVLLYIGSCTESLEVLSILRTYACD